MENKKRLANFEVLRCAMMLMIVVIHVFAHGEKYASVTSNFCFELDTLCGGINFMVSQIADTIAVTAVNLFIFITGYFMIESHKLSLQKIIKLWIPVAFYSVIIAAVQFGGAILDYMICRRHLYQSRVIRIGL